MRRAKTKSAVAQRDAWPDEKPLLTFDFEKQMPLRRVPRGDDDAGGIKQAIIRWLNEQV